MPRVPLPTEQLRPGGGPVFSAPGVTPVANAAPRQIEDAGRALSTLGAAAIEIQDTINTARTKEADSISREFDRNVLEGDDGYLFTVGRAATDRREDVLKRLETERERIERSLDNDVQRRMFREATSRRRVAVLGAINEHYHRAAYEYEAGQTKVRAESAAKDAIRSWQDPEKAETEAWRRYAMSMGSAMSRVSATRQGTTGAFRTGGSMEVEQPFEVPPPDPHAAFKQNFGTAVSETHHLMDMAGEAPDSDRRKAAVRAITSSIHAGIFERLADTGQTDTARKYLARVPADELDAGVETRMRSVLQEATTKKDGAVLALKLWQEQGPTIVTGDRERRRTALDRYSEVNAKLDELSLTEASQDVVDNARTRLRAMYIGEQETEAQFRLELLTQATDLLSADVLATTASLPSTLVQQLKDENLMSQVEEFSTSRNRFPQKNPLAFYELLDLNKQQVLARWPTPATFVFWARSQFDDAHFETAKAVYSAALKPGNKRTPEEDTLIGKADIVKRAAENAGLIPKPGIRPVRLSTEQYEDLNRFEADVQARKQFYAASNEPKEWQEVVDEAVLDVVMVRGTPTIRSTLTPAEWLPEQKTDAPTVLVDGVEVRSTEIPPNVERWLIDRVLELPESEREPITFANIADMWLKLGRPVAPPQKWIDENAARLRAKERKDAR